MRFEPLGTDQWAKGRQVAATRCSSRHHDTLQLVTAVLLETAGRCMQLPLQRTRAASLTAGLRRHRGAMVGTRRGVIRGVNQLLSPYKCTKILTSVLKRERRQKKITDRAADARGTTDMNSNTTVRICPVRCTVCGAVHHGTAICTVSPGTGGSPSNWHRAAIASLFGVGTRLKTSCRSLLPHSEVRWTGLVPLSLNSPSVLAVTSIMRA